RHSPAGRTPMITMGRAGGPSTAEPMIACFVISRPGCSGDTDRLITNWRGGRAAASAGRMAFLRAGPHAVVREPGSPARRWVRRRPPPWPEPGWGPAVFVAEVL